MLLSPPSERDNLRAQCSSPQLWHFAPATPTSAAPRPMAVRGSSSEFLFSSATAFLSLLTEHAPVLQTVGLLADTFDQGLDVDDLMGMHADDKSCTANYASLSGMPWSKVHWKPLPVMCMPMAANSLRLYCRSVRKVQMSPPLR